MTNPFVFYVLGSSICLMLFLVVYRLLIANLTYFSWMRMYLLISVILSLILPLVTLHIQWKSSIHTADLFNYAAFLTGQHAVGYSGGQALQNDLSNNLRSFLIIGIPIFLITGYISGFLYRALIFARN